MGSKMSAFRNAFILALLLLPSQVSAQAHKPSPCTSPEYRQLDFWGGDWDAFDYSDQKTVAARTKVDRILNDCVLFEDYQGVNGTHGESFSIYDSTRKVWHQTWVTTRGQLLVIEGKFQDGKLVMDGTDHAAGALVHATWEPIQGGVREIAKTSTDGGKTWKEWFDMVFRPHVAAGESDERKIAALDTEYQKAVERNDAATMDRLLADGFILRTGTGKTFTKSDLLEEARSGHIVYERQDDSEQSVHVFGDTAIITAKLFAKGTENGQSFEYSVWFSDTYVRTPTGWKYSYAQSAGRLPKA